MLQINKTVANGKAVFALEGRLDTVTAPEMESAMQEVLPELTSLTLDFAGLEYISSAGLRVLLAAQKAMNVKGEMRVKNVSKAIMEIFEITGFSDVLTIE
ncbi:MAG: STAS domain-containing protein [Oscillospiraceae bacterium]|nr:STAS domain-containing protein [Oscillospiraceae bacterium]